MSAAGNLRRQAALLVRLRQLRMDIAARALANARAVTAQAEAARRAADRAATNAQAARTAARDGLVDNPQEAERLLAVADQMQFRQAIASQALDDARTEEQTCVKTEALKRHGMILARARHAGVEERARLLARQLARRREERDQSDFEDRRLRT